MWLPLVASLAAVSAVSAQSQNPPPQSSPPPSPGVSAAGTDQKPRYIVVAEASCRYLRPARYDELLRVRTRISQAGNRVMKYAYELLRDSDGTLLATGATTHVICGRDGKPKQLPEKYRAKFRQVAGKTEKSVAAMK